MDLQNQRSYQHLLPHNNAWQQSCFLKSFLKIKSLSQIWINTCCISRAFWFENKVIFIAFEKLLFKADLNNWISLKQVFKILLWKHIFNRLKPRFNRLNESNSYTTDSKRSFTTSSQLSDKQPVISINQLVVFPLLEKTPSFLKQF